MAIVHGEIGGAEPSTVTFKVDTVTLSQNSTTVHREVLVLGDPQSSIGYATVLAGAPASTDYGLTVRGAGTFTTAGDSSCVQKTSPWVIAGNSTVSILQPTSTAAPASNDTGVVVRQVGYSTIVSVANTVTIAGNSTAVQGTNPWLVAVTGPISSAAPSAGDSGVIVRQVGYSTIVSVANTVAIQGNSTVVVASGNSSVIVTSGNSSVIITSGNSSVTIHGDSTSFQGGAPWTVSVTTPISSAAPSSGSSGVVVRPVWDNRLTAASTNAFASTTFAINSSVAGVRAYVTAYSITSTVAAGTTLRFMQGSTLLWPIVLQAVSSAVTGANLSAYPYLFRNPAAARPMSIDVDSSLAGFKVGVSYYVAP